MDELQLSLVCACVIPLLSAAAIGLFAVFHLKVFYSLLAMASPKVFFVLGGPGSGKGTNCARLVQEYGFTHYCAGDLLREVSAKEDTELAKKIADLLRRGQIIPSEVTVELLRSRIVENPNPRGFLLDGFPRKMDQAQMFEESIAKARSILFFDCTEETMEKRLLSRLEGGSSRSDDNIETIKTRFRVNAETCQPVVDHYLAQNRLKVIDANKDTEAVYAQVQQILQECGETPLPK